jgi:DNA-binding NarL/FixJ family response regulator
MSPLSKMKMTKHRIFMVDDHPLVREWLRTLINTQSDLEVCGEAEDAPSALSGIAEAQPELAIIDLSLAKGSGIDLIKDLRKSQPDVSIVVLSMHDESFYAERALRAGAQAYVVKRESTSQILAAVRSVISGGIYLNPRFTDELAQKFVAAGSSGSPIELLSDRELEVFRLLGQGQTTSSIASELSINLKTVQAYCARIKEKLDLSNVSELLRAAIRWVDQDL